MCMSRFVGATGGFEYEGNPCFDGRFTHLTRPEYETEVDRHGREVAVEFIREHPGEEARLWLRRLGATFHSDGDGLAAVESYGDDVFLDDALRERVRDLSDVYALVVMLAAIPGAVLLVARRRPDGVLVVVSALGMLLPVVLFFGDPRFKMPIIPAVAVSIATLATSIYRIANVRT